MEDLVMVKKSLLLISLFCTVSLIDTISYDWRPQITEAELDIEIQVGETCYQYAERKVNQMKDKYRDRRIVGTLWLSYYWAHHYEGALIYRNNFWLPV